jgi:hypothetical protein
VGLEEFGDVGGIKQSGLHEDARAEPVVPEIGVDDVAVKREAEDFQFHDCARRERYGKERTNAGLRDVLELPNPLAIVVQFGEPNGQVTGNAFIKSAFHSLPKGIAKMSEIL